MRGPTASIIIVTHDNRALVQSCLDAVRRSTLDVPYELLVVDNNSQDGTVRLLDGYAASDDRIRVIYLPDNHSFAHANNIGVLRSIGKYLLFLNVDTIPTSGWLGRLLAHVRGTPSAGAVLPVTNYAGNELRINVSYRNLVELEQFAARLAREKSGQSRCVAVAPLFCALVPRRVWNEVGPLDTRFEIGMFEDDDYSVRIRQSGYNILCAENSFVHHFGARSFGGLDPPRYFEIHEKNRKRFEEKWGRPWTPHKYREGVEGRPREFELADFRPASLMQNRGQVQERGKAQSSTPPKKASKKPARNRPMSASARGPKILVYGHYGNRNTGDEAILGAILEDLSTKLPEASVFVISQDVQHTRRQHKVRAIDRFDVLGILEEIEDADLVIVGGGGLFHDTWGFEPDRVLTTQLQGGFGAYVLPALCGALAQKRVMLWGVGVGPLVSDLAKNYAKAACLAADVVTVRDEPSKTLLESAGVPSSKITVTADSAFAYKPSMRGAGSLKKSAAPERSDGGPTVGVMVRQWGVGVSPRYWERQLAEALDKFVRSERGRLVFVPFQTLETEKENDVAVAERIAARLSSQADVRVVEEHLTPGEIKEVIAGCDLVVGMRLHAVVFAAQAGVPVVALSYDPKVSALMERVGIPEFDFPLRNIQSAGLPGLMTQALRRKPEIAASLRAASAELVRQAARNIELACELLKRPPEPKPLPPELVSVVASAIKGQLTAAKRSNEQLKFRKDQLDELSACVRKEHAHNEQLIGQLKQKQEQVEELSACVRKQHADNEQLISSVAKLREQLQGRDRFVLQLEQRPALEKREVEKRLQELTQDHTQALELSANLRQELAAAQQSRQQLALMINRRLSVRLRRSLHKLLDISQARTPEPLRRALRGFYLPVYRLLFPSGKGEFETLDSLGASNVSLRKDKGRPA